ncbi:hypothetical protein [Streptomyces sp. NPDC002386]
MPKRAAAVGVDTGGPFKALPPGLPDRLRPYAAEITEEVVRAIGTQIAEYARPMDDTYMQGVHRGVDHALRGLLERMSQPDTDWQPVKETYERIGRGEAEEGRSLDSFQSALRLGARVTWRRVNALVDGGAAAPRRTGRLRRGAVPAPGRDGGRRDRGLHRGPAARGR